MTGPVGDPTTALVTGGCGFVGGYLVQRLLRDGYRVVVLDRRTPRAGPAAVEWVRGDVTDLDRCRELVRACRPGLVFHLAAAATIDAAHENPHGSLATNVLGTVNMVESVRTAARPPTRFVLASTDKVYGELHGPAYVERSPTAARGVYDVGKMAADRIVRTYGEEFGVPVTTLRLCNVFGPGDANTASRIVPRSLSRLFGQREPLPPVVYEGSIGHGRDYVYVTDAVCALMTLATHPDARGRTFNMAPAAHRTTLDLVEELIDRAVRICWPIDPDRAEAIRGNGYEIVGGAAGAPAIVRQHCDSSRIRDLLGFRIEVDFADGLDRTIRSFAMPARPARSNAWPVESADVS